MLDSAPTGERRPRVEMTPLQHGAGYLALLGLLLLGGALVSDAVDWYRSVPSSAVPDRTGFLVAGGALFLIGMVIVGATSEARPAPEPMPWREATVAAIKSLPVQTIIFLVIMRVIHGKIEIRSALISWMILFSFDLLRNRYPRWGTLARKRRTSADEKPAP